MGLGVRGSMCGLECERHSGPCPSPTLSLQESTSESDWSQDFVACFT